ncbi:helix-turn-helix transcriptional regulator [Arthrobacter crystallopoietes]|uniref:helix-turn-helix transcriptional regulator n=1 Tax=Crystallibacter crystallopoietes TaxID=37928 RepID=UPI00111116D7|nr:hypothetical protein [Arthrobacter crystallopoietes]
MALISPRIVEQQYGITVTQLRRWRRLGIGPEYFQFTSRTVCYSEEYLHDWLLDPDNAEFTHTRRVETVDRYAQKVPSQS